MSFIPLCDSSLPGEDICPLSKLTLVHTLSFCLTSFVATPHQLGLGKSKYKGCGTYTGGRNAGREKGTQA